MIGSTWDYLMDEIGPVAVKSAYSPKVSIFPFNNITDEIGYALLVPHSWIICRVTHVGTVKVANEGNFGLKIGETLVLLK